MEISKKGFEVYLDMLENKLPKKTQKPKVDFYFDYCNKVQISRYPPPGKITVKFYKEKTVTYWTDLYGGMFANTFQRFVEDWKGEALNESGEVVETFNFLEELKKSRVRINFDSSSLGDTIAWMGYVEKFKKKYEISNLNVATFYNDLFKSEYPDINFEEPNKYNDKNKILIGLGWYDEKDRNLHKEDPRLIPLQKVATDILGVKYIGDLRPRMDRSKILPRPTEKKYVCIVTHSTAGAKHWHYPDGWQKLVDFLVSKGFDVVNIQQHKNELKNVIDKTGDHISLSDRISDLSQCEFFVGLGSGVSWVAWALEKPVVLISGFSQPFCEFADKTLRIINKDVCHGCFNNPNHKFDKSWWWCPEHKDTERHFECTKNITAEDVCQKISEWEHFNP